MRRIGIVVVAVLLVLGIGLLVVLQRAGPPAEKRADSSRTPAPRPARSPSPASDPGRAGVAVAGVVLGADGEPCGDVLVVLGKSGARVPPDVDLLDRLVENDDGTTGLLAGLRTDGHGRFAFSTEESGPFLVLAASDAQGNARVDGVARGRTDLVVRLVPGCAIRGVVVDDLGDPIEGAFLGFPWAAAISAADGSFHLEGLAFERDLGLPIRATGHVDALPSIRLRAGETTVLEDPIVLRRELGLSGRVLLPDGRPAQGIHVRLRTGSPSSRSRRTDSAGRYDFKGAIPARWTVLAEDARFLPARVSGRREGGEARALVPDLVLRKGGGIVVRVLDEKGRPVAGARVVAWPTDAEGPAAVQGLDESVSRPYLTGRDGRFRIRGLDTGTFAVLAFTEDPRSGVARDIVVRGGADSAAEIRLRPPDTIEGRVLDAEGTPVRASVLVTTPASGVAGLVLRRTMPQASSNDDGRFVLPVFGEGPFAILAMAVGYESREVEDVVPGARNMEIRLGLPATASASGQVVCAETGRPIAGASVTAASVTDSKMGRMEGLYDSDMTRVEGTFRVANLPPGRRVLIARAKGYALRRLEVDVPERAERRDVVFRMTRGGTVVGTARTPAGEPAAELTVTLYPFGSGWCSFRVQTDAYGAFRFEHVPAGTHPITVLLPPDGSGRNLVLKTAVKVVDGETTRVALGD